ncbi:MAG: radical SAM/SPASM domain-containing protein [Bacteroidales bacterium]
MRRWRSQYHDALALLRCLTLRRALNLISLWLTFGIARYTRWILVPAGPAAISAEPTTRCNLRCPECPSGLRQFTRPTGNIDPEVFNTWLSSLQHQVLWLNLYFQGEPMLHPGFFDLVKMARAKKMYTMTSTNGHYLDDDHCRGIIASGLHRLVVSLDGMDQETYEQYRRGGDLNRVLEGIRRLAAMKRELGSRTPHLEVQFLVLRTNEHQLGEVRRLMKLHGVDAIAFKSAQIYNFREGSPLIPETDRYSRYRKHPDGTCTLKSKLPNYCRRAWFSTVITWDGMVVPCCYDKDATFAMGSLQSDPFTAIWKGKKYRSFRKKLFSRRSTIPICTNCSEGLTLH